jgi:hypothetical protein
MNDQPNETPTPPEPLSPREARQERREARRSRMGGSWVGGAILILLGVIFLLQNQGITTLQNWWALFILLPAFGAFGNAWRSYQEAGYLNRSARNSLFWGLILTLVSVIFLLNLNWTWLGPAILIVMGIGILVNALLPGEPG